MRLNCSILSCLSHLPYFLVIPVPARRSGVSARRRENGNPGIPVKTGAGIATSRVGVPADRAFQSADAEACPTSNQNRDRCYALAPISR